MNHSAIIFDLDGTLTISNLDFDQVRSEIGVTGPILEAMQSMNPQERERAATILHRHEFEAAKIACLQDGARETIDACKTRGHPVAILTRNSRASAGRILERFEIKVDMLRTREDGAIKPSAEPVLAICSELGADPARSWMIGDYLFDIEAGLAAGTTTVLIVDGKPVPQYADKAHHVIGRLADLLELLDTH